MRELLTQFGAAVLDEPAQIAQRLGLRVTETGGIHVKAILRGGAAERAGFCAGDEWLGVELPVRRGVVSSWRLMKLDELPLYLGQNARFSALVSRDRKLVKLPVSLPAAVTTWRILPRDAAALDRWLA